MEKKIVIITRNDIGELIKVLGELYNIVTLDLFQEINYNDENQRYVLSKADIIVTTEKLEVQMEILTRFNQAKLLEPYFRPQTFRKDNGERLKIYVLDNIKVVEKISSEFYILWTNYKD